MAKVICIDDDKDILEACTVALEAKGHKVATAAGGEEGYNKAKAFKPDLIIMDVMMDNFTDGFHTAYKFRNDAALKYIPIMLLTSVNDHVAQKFDKNTDGEYLPVDAFVEKPLKPKDLAAKAAELLALKKDQINIDGKARN